MQQTNCPQCGSPLKFVNGGISYKSGAAKSYPAFYSCTSPACNYSFNPPTATTRPIPGTPVPIPAPDPYAPPAPAQQPAINRNDEISWLNAKNNACLLIAHHPHFAKKDDIKTTIENLAFFIFKATKTSVEAKLAPKPIEPPEIPDTSDIDPEEIPF